VGVQNFQVLLIDDSINANNKQTKNKKQSKKRRKKEKQNKRIPNAVHVITIGRIYSKTD
jgi:ribosomal protein L39E